MKKIVALVLSLVMALSLCTVAFGANVKAYAKDMVTGKVNTKVGVEVQQALKEPSRVCLR